MSLIYGVRLIQEDGDFVVTVRDLPEVCTAGSTADEALALAADAIDAVICHRIGKGQPLALPSPVLDGEHAVSPPLQTAMKAALYMAFAESGITKVELARRLGINEAEARRILNPKHNSRIGAIEAAAKALGARFDVGMAR